MITTQTYFFNNKYDAVNSPYFSLAEVPCKVEKLLENSFSVYHINIRSLNKNFDKLLEFLSIMKNEFDIIAISETWCNDDNNNINWLYQIPNYTPIHQIRETGNKGEVWYCICIKLLLLLPLKN